MEYNNDGSDLHDINSIQMKIEELKQQQKRIENLEKFEKKQHIINQNKNKEELDKQLENMSIDDYIKKNEIILNQTIEEISKIDDILYSKIPVTNDEKLKDIQGLTCNDAYKKQIQTLNENYKKYFKDQTGNDFDNTDVTEIPEHLNFDPEIVLQLNFFPIYYHLKPMFTNIMKTLLAQNLTLTKLLTYIDKK